MGEKMTCPGCNSHTSSVLFAVRDGDPCPNCGLSAAAIVEVTAARQKLTDAAFLAKYEEAVLRAGRAEAGARRLRETLDAVRFALEAGGLPE